MDIFGSRRLILAYRRELSGFSFRFQHEWHKILWECANLFALSNCKTCFAAKPRRGYNVYEVHSWPHAPSKAVNEPGTYFVTAATHHKEHFFRSHEKLTLLQTVIFDNCLDFDFQLQAWAIFSNHYHLVGFSQVEGAVKKMTDKIHGVSARELNRLDDAVGRQVWYRMRDTRLTFERSYLARLNYVHNNPTKHGFGSPLNYPFCSAHWFETKGEPSFVRTVKSFEIDQIKIDDDF